MSFKEKASGESTKNSVILSGADSYPQKNPYSLLVERSDKALQIKAIENECYSNLHNYKIIDELMNFRCYLCDSCNEKIRAIEEGV